jgi:hypothetical protein
VTTANRLSSTNCSIHFVHAAIGSRALLAARARFAQPALIAGVPAGCPRVHFAFTIVDGKILAPRNFGIGGCARGVQPRGRHGRQQPRARYPFDEADERLPDVARSWCSSRWWKPPVSPPVDRTHHQ